MQAIITKYHGPTNTRGSTVSARCARGKIKIPYDDAKNSGENHLLACKLLCNKFVAEDVKKYGEESRARNFWGKPRATGSLPSGEFAHVTIQLADAPATSPEKWRDRAKQTAMNAARICSLMPSDKLEDMARAVNFDAVATTAGNLAQIETEPGFNWEGQRWDWETVCDRCAQFIAAKGESVRVETIRKFIGAPDRQTRGGWVRYPLAPDKVGNLVEDLALIQRLIGSVQYESKQVNGLLYIRRV